MAAASTTGDGGAFSFHRHPIVPAGSFDLTAQAGELDLYNDRLWKVARTWQLSC